MVRWGAFHGPHPYAARLRLTDRYPLIVEAAQWLRATSFVLDGEGVILWPTV